MWRTHLIGGKASTPCQSSGMSPRGYLEVASEMEEIVAFGHAVLREYIEIRRLKYEVVEIEYRIGGY
jgi:hypothetical protein